MFRGIMLTVINLHLKATSIIVISACRPAVARGLTADRCKDPCPRNQFQLRRPLRLHHLPRFAQSKRWATRRTSSGSSGSYRGRRNGRSSSSYINSLWPTKQQIQLSTSHASPIVSLLFPVSKCRPPSSSFCDNTSSFRSQR